MSTIKRDITTRRMTRSIYKVVFECAASIHDYLNDEGDTIIYTVIAENPAQALSEAMTSLVYLHEDWNEKDILRADVMLTSDELLERKNKEDKLLKK